MNPVGESYRPAGPISARSIMTTLILGTVVALLSALAIWLWEISPIPTLVILTSIIHGGIIGSAMMFMVGRLRMRNPWLIGMVGLACGLLSVALVHYGHYVNLVNSANADVRKFIAEDNTASPDQKKAAIEDLEKNPNRPADEFLQVKTGHGGFLGSLLLRNEIGITIKRATVSGIVLWLLWGAEAIFVVYMAMSMPMARASEPFCEECLDWCHETTSPLSFAGSAGDMLATAVREDSAPKVVEAYTNPPKPDPITIAPAVKSFQLAKPSVSLDSPVPINVSMHRCPTCDLAFASLSVMVPNGKEMKKVELLKQVCVSPETAAALEQVPAADLLEAEQVLPEGEVNGVEYEGNSSMG